MDKIEYQGCSSPIWPDRHEKYCVCCKKCGSAPKDHIVKNYSMMWHDGDVYCKKCGEYVRMYDAG